MQKYKQVKINLTLDQYQKIKYLAEKEGKYLSTFIKEQAELENKLDSVKPKNRIKKIVDPNLLYELNKMGNNINQIAKKLNIEKETDQTMLMTLIAIQKNLEDLLNDYSN
ncbi:MAG: plasmid mobilization relaxosome protein MobC [Arcobacter sp.]|nr:plasmid mobilization relaxosome protein MobC [Arcobacter sp.]